MRNWHGRRGREKRRRPKSVSFSIFLQGLLLGFSELQVRARSFQIEKFNGVAPRPGGVAHLAKCSFRSGPMFPASVPACFLAGGPFSSLTEVTSKELMFSFKLAFFFFSCPISERPNPISCPLMRLMTAHNSAIDSCTSNWLSYSVRVLHSPCQVRPTN